MSGRNTSTIKRTLKPAPSMSTQPQDVSLLGLSHPGMVPPPTIIDPALQMKHPGAGTSAQNPRKRRASGQPPSIAPAPNMVQQQHSQQQHLSQQSPHHHLQHQLQQAQHHHQQLQQQQHQQLQQQLQSQQYGDPSLAISSEITDVDSPQLDQPTVKKGRTNTPWTASEEQRLKVMRDDGKSWSEIAKTFPNRTEGSVKKHWYKDMHYAEFDTIESAALLAAIKEYDANKWKSIGAKLGKPAKACEQFAKQNFSSKQ